MKKVLLLLILIFSFGCITKRSTVVKVIDGDTIELIDGDKVRLAGINTPEKGELCYYEAKLFSESNLLGKDVGLVILGKDKYGRTLAEVYVDNQNFNLALLREGFANAYYNDGVNWEEYLNAQDVGIKRNGCIWQKSDVGPCVEVERIGSDFLVRNVCDVTIVTNVTVRDTSASHRFKVSLHLGPHDITTITEGCCSSNRTICLCQNVFNSDGDMILIYDEKGLLGWSAYGKYFAK